MSTNLRHLPTVINLGRVEVSRLGGPRLVRADDAPWPPPGWAVGHRESCKAGHPDSEECELCRGELIDAGGDAT